jgi:hypothetical protein
MVLHGAAWCCRYPCMVLHGAADSQGAGRICGDNMQRPQY